MHREQSLIDRKWRRRKKNATNIYRIYIVYRKEWKEREV